MGKKHDMEAAGEDSARDALIAEVVADHASVGFIFVDDEGMIRYINPQAKRILGVRKREAVGKRVDMLPLRIPLYKVLSENCRDNPVEVSVSGAVLLVRSIELKKEGVQGDLFEVRDITEEKRERRQREEFVAMMTHDLKSPLTVMMGYIQAIKCGMVGEVDKAMQPCIEELNSNSLRLLGMIEDVLDAYRLEVGLLSIARTDCDLCDILRGCCRDAYREAERKGIRQTSTIPDSLPMHIDPKQLSRVFANLLGNALKFTPSGGEVACAATEDGNHVTITVSDTGIGIALKDQQKVFNKYFRTGAATGFKGTGLGLAISKAIVEAHGGTIHVESREGEGSTFRVVLPMPSPRCS